MNLQIFVGGFLQLDYGFHIIITLDRVYKNTIELTVLPNLVVGDCCENELEIVT
jgi:hypothetical protein